jgi:hypothetical protein
MRTCAAAILASQSSGNPWDISAMGCDAARLLIEAADVLAVRDVPVLSERERQSCPSGIAAPGTPIEKAYRPFDDGSKRGLARGNDQQAMRFIGRQR